MPIKKLGSKASSHSQGRVSVVSERVDNTINLDFGHYVAIAFGKFSCPIIVVVLSETRQEPIVIKKRSQKQPEAMSRLQTSASSLKSLESSITSGFPLSTLVIKSVCNANDHVVEVNITKYQYRRIPREVISILGTVLPYFTTIERITVKECLINGYIIHEINEILSTSSVTEVCLDGSLVNAYNYDILLNKAKLRNLSLSRCNLYDDQCIGIFSKLHYGMPAESSLKILNLSYNFITDTGAKYIGDALRTNRSLRYLNLSNNQLSDTGAKYIFNVLNKFQLTDKEILQKRQHYMNYLRESRRVLLTSVLSDTNITERSGMTTKGKASISKPKTSAKKNTKQEQAADTITARNYFHPYSKTFLTSDQRHCKGNMVLCYLNLAYNNLSYISLVSIQSALLHQQPMVTADQCGLLALVLEGNFLPPQCDALELINDLLTSRRSQFSPSSRRRTTTLSDKSAFSSARKKRETSPK